MGEAPTPVTIFNKEQTAVALDTNPVGVYRYFVMRSVLQQQVIVLNSGWQAIHSRTVQEAILMLCADSATALEINGDDDMRPVTWAEWITLPIREGDDVVHSAKLTIRAPTVIVAVNYHKCPTKRPKFNLRGVAQRDGNRCQYTGRVLRREELSMDHVVPKSRGGRDHWTNVVLADKALNTKKGNRLNEELGLKLLRKPVEPVPVPTSVHLVPTHPHHKLFL